MAGAAALGSRFAACPICDQQFHHRLLAHHAARCGVPAALAIATTAGKETQRVATTAEPAPLVAPITGTKNEKRARSSAFGPLRAPGPKDIRPSRRRRGLDAPAKEFNYLIVLDFEWTADDRARMVPHAEIIEWSCVLVDMTTRPARMVSELQIYVKPEHNPVLTAFSKELTAISQSQVNAGCSLREAILKFEKWMSTHGLIVVTNETRIDNTTMMGTRMSTSKSTNTSKLDYAIVTWSDADLGSTLPTQMRALGIPRRPHFDSWINLKLAYERVYKKSSRGLQCCVEAIGLVFDGRAHSGLVDSINTAKIVLDMVNRQNFRGFVRTTRFLTSEWEMIGSRRAKSAKSIKAGASIGAR